MRGFSIWVVSLISLFFCSASVYAGESIVESVKRGCNKEIKSYCKRVTPGEGRVLACLYAHSDRLSGQCEYALYDAAAQLERAVAALTYVANECDDDLRRHCSSVAVGEGRLLACLDRNASRLQKRCNQALRDVGLR